MLYMYKEQHLIVVWNYVMGFDELSSSTLQVYLAFMVTETDPMCLSPEQRKAHLPYRCFSRTEKTDATCLSLEQLNCKRSVMENGVQCGVCGMYTICD